MCVPYYHHYTNFDLNIDVNIGRFLHVKTAKIVLYFVNIQDTDNIIKPLYWFGGLV